MKSPEVETTMPLSQGIKRTFPEQEAFQTGLGSVPGEGKPGPSHVEQRHLSTQKGLAGQESRAVGREIQAGPDHAEGATEFHPGGSELQHL